MLFNSLLFLVFFVIVTSLYFSLNYRHRWKLLLLASCYFYMSFAPFYIFILGFTIFIDYFAGIVIENAKGHKRKAFLLISLLANLGVLCLFKYYNFINDNLSLLLTHAGLHNHLPALSILLPIGLSFHTFQAMSYTIEVYRGNQPAERHFGIYALYVMFYPQLVAGPIERPQNLLHQFREVHEFNFQEFKSGITQMTFGLFKKVVIADRLSMAVDYAYKNYQTQSGLSMSIAIVLYSFQIYCDFSAYSDIAIGAARVMGFKLMTNFESPYFARSVSEFWKRWHISLSTWFRDYVYIPLGGNRRPKSRSCLNLFIVFILSGLWHGANWTFVIWGALHGTFVIIEKLFESVKKKNRFTVHPTITTVAGTALTFCLVSMAWVFFRSETAAKALHILTLPLRMSGSDSIDLRLNQAELVFCFLLIAGLLLKEKKVFIINIQNNYIFSLIIFLLAVSSYFFGVFNQQQFIYFQF